jgi:hypothetical protein
VRKPRASRSTSRPCRRPTCPTLVQGKWNRYCSGCRNEPASKRHYPPRRCPICQQEFRNGNKITCSQACRNSFFRRQGGRKSIEEKFWARITQTADGCWQWEGHCNPDGYGQICLRGGYRSAHRFSYELLVGPITPGLTIDHLCRNRPCVNPGHMEVVPLRENVQRGYRDRGFPVRGG